MFDLHCHSVFSDGELIPAEIWQRVKVLGYIAIAITDHADQSNYEFIITNLLKIKEALRGLTPQLLVGVELTHVPPHLIPELIPKARNLGAEIVIVHGETIVEPVAAGTNRAAILGGADILAHPGLISEEEVNLAKEKGVFLELSGRRGHSLTNGHVARLALKHGVPLVINSDAHSPSDLLTPDLAFKIALGAGLTKEEVENLWKLAQRRFLKSP
ncbi:MAG: histidinol phosphate phosphatase domain-containing protein [Caldimicrobium sp.]|nr:histidinol phosphate phosphatase domain-containing protein [Caldimicrobium sp.]MCX7874166.1 histidinol phosphate phosphatase domain-containing protein [Caldimicrobium sp.]MDW8093700.1 histidinol phosphate phosphatase domain-containing protein [Caldimicrobium sp.]